MLKSFKTEINPTEEQKTKIRKTIGTCRFIYNFYLAHNKKLHEDGKKFMSSNKFRIWLNNEYLPQHPEYSWIKEAYSKAVTQSVNNGQTAFTRFFNHESAFPNFKKKGKSDVKMYFVKNNPKDCHCERHRIKIPSLGWVRIKEKGYIPTTKDGYVIKERFGFNALEMTSSEIIEKLLEMQDKEAIADLRSLFETADLVKFAKHNPLMNENDANLINAIEFINETKEKEVENAKPQPTEITIIEKRSLRTKILLGIGIVVLSVALIGSFVYIGMQLYNYFA